VALSATPPSREDSQEDNCGGQMMIRHGASLPRRGCMRQATGSHVIGWFITSRRRRCARTEDRQATLNCVGRKAPPLARNCGEVAGAKSSVERQPARDQDSSVLEPRRRMPPGAHSSCLPGQSPLWMDRRSRHSETQDGAASHALAPVIRTVPSGEASQCVRPGRRPYHPW
jgi:hypothetical protein